MNHEELIDSIRAYVGSQASWESINDVTIHADGVVTVRWTGERANFNYPARRAFAKEYTRMRDEARERDREGLKRLGAD